jgi:hypothetical protein
VKTLSQILILAATLLSTPLLGQDQGTLVGVGTWDSAGKNLRVKLTHHLKPKQRNLINSGFSTYSSLLLLPMPARSNLKPFYKTSCVVKLDTWEELYDVTIIQDNPRPFTTKSIQEYFEKCLTVNLDAETIRKTLGTNGGNVLAILNVEQISQAQSKKIKKWLVRQQSGVMQGLFSHMLGEMRLRETVTVKVQIPSFKKKSAAIQPQFKVSIKQ